MIKIQRVQTCCEENMFKRQTVQMLWENMFERQTVKMLGIRHV